MTSIITLCKTHLKHVVQKVHCCAPHVDGDRVEEEDGVVLSDAEHHIMVDETKLKDKKKEEE